MGLFFSDCNVLKLPQEAIKSQFNFLTIVESESATGVPQGALDYLCWILEYLIAGPCHRPLSAIFSYVKNPDLSVAEAIGNFGP